MELNGAASRLRPRKAPSADRFLGPVPVFSQSSDLSSSSSTIDELNEDDVFFSGDFSPDRDESNGLYHNRNPNFAATPSPSYFSSQKPFSQSQNFGIVEALRNPSRPQSHFYQKTSISTSSGSSSPSSSRLIPLIPKPPQERLLLSSSLGRYHQSAPVNVPLLAKAMHKQREFDDFDEDEDVGGEMVPPHEIVARSMADSPILACSVLEGVGRTLKGRDLRQVRNAIWRQTGFLD